MLGKAWYASLMSIEQAIGILWIIRMSCRVPDRGDLAAAI